MPDNIPDAAVPRSPVTIDDVLAASYTNVQAPPPMTALNSALLLIDIQHLAAPDYLHDLAVKSGLPSDEVRKALSDYDARFNAAVAQARRVLEKAREVGIPPIHVKIQTLSHQGRDTGALHRRMGWLYPPNSAATKFLDATKPAPDEIVITKTSSGAFSGTSLDATLRNMGIDYLFVCGFVTDECVETTVRVALDLGYLTMVIEDATQTYKAEAHLATIHQLSAYGITQSADDTITAFGQVASVQQAGAG
ncbi:cysteine hydrolase family protein [Hyphomonas sp. NPDC076900]|uniref:cysteine hydrolase family protein n=1 Tax=unclassified Hyphomonas TaxID=2630699 RepID=UPI003CFC2B4A